MPIDYGNNNVTTSGNIIAATGNFTGLSINNIPVSLNGHSHGNITSDGKIGSTSGLLVVTTTDGSLTSSSGVNSSLISNFNSSVSGLVSGIYAPISHLHGNITNAGAIGSTANLPLITTTAGAVTTGSFGSTANTFCQGNDSRLSDSRTPLSHTHGSITNAGAIGSTANLPLITTTAGAITTGSFGSSVNTFCQGNDSRLSDSRTPLGHTHGNITNAGAIGATANLPLITTTAGAITVGSFGNTANSFCVGNDSRLSDTRTPTDGTVTTAKIVDANVTYAKIQNVSATDRLLGRSTAGAGVVQEIACTAFGRSLIDDADASAARTTLGAASSSHTHTVANITDLSKTFCQFSSKDNYPPSSSFATIDTRNSILVLDFDDSLVESAVFLGIVPDNIVLTSGITVRIAWMATSATSGNVRWRVEFEKGNTDYDADSFDTSTEANSTAAATAGIPVYVDISSTTIDSLSAGDLFRIRISRVGTDATNDTMVGDAELIAISLRYN